MNESLDIDPQTNVLIQLGISIEPLVQIQQQLLSKQSSNAIVLASSTPSMIIPPIIPTQDMVNGCSIFERK